MPYQKKAYVEHVAIRVKDIHWHIRFFREVLGMTLRDVDGAAESPRQVWTFGGLQLMADPDFEGPEGRLAHLGVMCEDVQAAIEAAAGFGVSHLDKGANWLVLPDGLIVELLPAAPGSVKAALAVNPRAQEIQT
jgi:predicted enzyme related to lactoylglutathione lyase